MRERLTYKKVFERCAEIRHKIDIGKYHESAELHITYAEFQDLRMDMDFINSLLWAHMSEPLKKFECCGVICVIGKEPG